MLRIRSRAATKQTLAADHRSHPQPAPSQNRQTQNPPPLSHFLSRFRQLTVGTPGTPASRNRGVPAAIDGNISKRGRRRLWEMESDVRGIALVIGAGRSNLVLLRPEVRVVMRDPGLPDSPVSAEDTTPIHLLGNCRFVDSYFASRTDADAGTRTTRPKSSKTGGESFLSSCYTCKKIIEPTADIYIYRGEKAFCSWDCRHREILEDKYGEA